MKQKDREGASGWKGQDKQRTQRMAAGKLRLLRVFRIKLVSDAVQQLDVALLGVLLHRCYESPGHGACGLGGDCCVGPVRFC